MARHAELTDDFLDLELAFTGWMYQRLDSAFFLVSTAAKQPLLRRGK